MRSLIDQNILCGTLIQQGFISCSKKCKCSFLQVFWMILFYVATQRHRVFLCVSTFLQVLGSHPGYMVSNWTMIRSGRAHLWTFLKLGKKLTCINLNVPYWSYVPPGCKLPCYLLQLPSIFKDFFFHQMIEYELNQKYILQSLINNYIIKINYFSKICQIRQYTFLKTWKDLLKTYRKLQHLTLC